MRKWEYMDGALKQLTYKDTLVCWTKDKCNHQHHLTLDGLTTLCRCTVSHPAYSKPVDKLCKKCARLVGNYSLDRILFEKSK